MDWQAIGAIGEITGAFAVVLTLLYLAVQLKQNTGALRSTSWQAVQDAEQRFDSLLVNDPKLIALFLKGNTDGMDSLDTSERFQYFLIAKQLVDQFQTHHYQYELGMIEEAWWQTWISQYEEEIESSQGFRDMVKERYPHLRPSFREFVDAHPFSDDT